MWVYFSGVCLQDGFMTEINRYCILVMGINTIVCDWHIWSVAYCCLYCCNNIRPSQRRIAKLGVSELRNCWTDLWKCNTRDYITVIASYTKAYKICQVGCSSQFDEMYTACNF